jgi:peptidoglycan/LPS O-acetylase OafA/YrhL
MSFFPHIKIGNERYPALTGIRALGAMGVFFGHLPFTLGFNLAVDVLTFFFVLSGFLIFYLYYGNTDIASGRLYNYFINRFARIYPVYFLLVTIAIILRHDFSPVFLVKNYTLTHALFHDRSARAIEQSWSLTVEECFYLFAPLFMLLVRRFGFLISLLSGFILLGIALLVSQAHAPYLFLESADFVFSTTFFGHFFEFFCGIFLALAILKKARREIVDEKKFTWTMLGVAGSLIVISIPVILQYLHSPSQRVVYTGINNFILPVMVAVLFYGLMSERTLLSKFLSTRLLGWLGRTSYAFYLLHVLVIECIAVPYVQPLMKEYPNLYVIVVFIIAQLIAFLIFVVYEEPLNVFIRKRFRSGKKTGKVSGMHVSGEVEGLRG